MKTDIFDTDKKYGLFYTDPPWPQKKGNLRKCRPNQDRDLDYSTLSIPEIFELHKTFFAYAEQKHNVFMWTIDKFLHQTESSMEELGYKLHARMIWDKENGIAPAFTVRFCHEYLLWFYRRGNMLMPCESARGKYMTVFREPATTHSTKPRAAYEMLEDMFPDAQKIELFARRRRSGWDAWGDEVQKADTREVPRNRTDDNTQTTLF